MLRELNINEMDMVSGGCYQVDGSGECYDNLDDAASAARDQAEFREGGSGGGFDVFGTIGGWLDNPFSAIGNFIDGFIELDIKYGSGRPTAYPVVLPVL